MTFLKNALVFITTGVFLSVNINSQQTVEYEDIAGEELNSLLTAVPFLTIAPDSRAAGMGDVGVATSPDANSMHWNPSKYAFIEGEYGVCISYTPWLKKLVNDIDLLYLSGYYRFDNRQTISASLLYFSLGQIQFTYPDGSPIKTGEPNEYSFDIAYSRIMSKKLAMGVAFRYIRSDLTNGLSVGEVETSPGNQVAVDVSTYYQSDVRLGDYDGTMSYGLNISNIGAKLTYTDKTDGLYLPINMRLGGALTVDIDDYNSITASVDLNKMLVPTPPEIIDTVDENGIPYEIIIGKGDLNSAVPTGMFKSFSDAPGVLKGDGTRSVFQEELREITYGVGLEYWYAKQFAVRAGYFYEHKTKGNRKFFTMGLGLKYNVFGLDISYIIPQYPNNPLANTIRFSLIFNFEPVGNSNKAR